MRFTETRTIVILSCDRCGTRIDEKDGVPHGWLIAHVALSEAPMASVTHELCPTCREDLGMFMLNEKQPEPDKALIERLADVLYPMNEFADTPWNGADVCDMVAGILDEVAPWARHRQPQEPGDAFAAYQRERERLGL
jgi:hypothetical protein